MITIYGRDYSSNVQLVMWAVGELGLDHERLDYGHVFGGTDTPEFRALTPHRLVPVIRDGDLVMWESAAILRYLAATYGKGTLCPADTKTAGLADQWMDWTITSLNADIIGTGFIQLVRTAAADRDSAALAAAAKRAGERLQILDAQLAGRTFILGDTLTMGDIAVGSLMYRYFTLALPRPTLSNVEAWYQRLASRPAYREHVMIDFEAMKVPGA